MLKFKASIYFLIPFLVCGCTTLEVNRLTDPNELNSGLAYALQFTQYKIEITRSIANCTSPSIKDVDDTNIPLPKVLVKAEITSSNVDDGEHVYLVDAESLSAFTKVTDLKMNWNNGQLVSINASADDQTADILNSTIAGVAKIATARLAPVPLPSTALGPNNDPRTTVTFVGCTEMAASALAEVSSREAASKELANKIASSNLTITRLESDLKKVGVDTNIDCSLPINSDMAKCKLEIELNNLRVYEKDLSDINKAMNLALSKITHKDIYRWPNNSKEKTSANKSISDNVFNQWFREVQHEMLESEKQKLPSIHTQPPYQVGATRPLDEFKKQYDVVFTLGKFGSYGLEEPGTQDTPTESKAGIRYRVPANGFITICRISACNRDEDYAVTTLDGPVQQLGLIFTLPFESKAFTNKNFSLTFDDQGRLIEAGVATPESASSNVATTITTFADQYSTYIASAIAADDTMSELELLQEQTLLIEEQKKLADAQAALAPEITPLAELQEKTLFIEQQKKYVDALAALEASVAALPEATVDEQGMINSEATLLFSEAALLEAQITINSAEQTLQGAP